MTYTPKRVAALIDINARLDEQEKADVIEAVSVGTHGGKETKAIVKKMREVL